ncbi:MAG TPA: hypothetical protein PK006_10535, partial [Saprospiraceae bacterium]|nr:hypothetical protein [Saprospiraceae bacterium]
IEKGYSQKNNKIILDPYAWIKVFVKNTMPFDEMDYCFTSSDGGGGGHFGKDVDTTEIHLASGNRKTQILWRVHKNNTIKEYTDSLYIKAHDTAQYHINY